MFCSTINRYISIYICIHIYVCTYFLFAVVIAVAILSKPLAALVPWVSPWAAAAQQGQPAGPPYAGLPGYSTASLDRQVPRKRTTKEQYSRGSNMLPRP